MAYPSTLTTLTNPNATDKLNSPSHSSIHTAENTAITELQTFVGTLASTAGTLIYDIRATASDGGGHVQSANKGGTGQTSYTKGDILIASSASVLTKLAVGTDGLGLVADSATATGVKWGTLTGTFGGSGVDGAFSVLGTSSVTLTGTKFFTTLLVNPGGVLNTGGYAVYVNGTTSNAGVIQNSGGAGRNGSVSATLPTLSPGGDGGASAAGVIFAKGTSGKVGRGGSTGSPGDGDAADSLPYALGVAGARGGSGGGPGSVASGAAGSIVSEYLYGISAILPSVFNASSTTTISDVIQPKGSSSSSFLSTSAGSSGGGGGRGDGGSQQGGGGGGGGGSGGVLLLISNTIVNVGSIVAAGGAGGAGGNGAGSAYGGGGGGGGSGGVVILAFKTLTDTGTIAAPGGAAGAAGTGGAGSGSVGAAGNSGNVYKIQA